MHVLMCSGQKTIHAIYKHVFNQGINQGKSLLHTKLKGRICKYILVSFLYIHNRGKQIQVSYLHYLMMLKLKDLSQEVYYHNMSIIIT